MLFVRYLNKSIGAITQGISIPMGRESKRRRMQASLMAYCASHPWEYPPPDTPLIAIADAMWMETTEGWCTVYFIFLRPDSFTKAWIMPPIVVPGKESARGWQIAWEEVPLPLSKRICALVCDGKRSLHVIARHYGWQVQLCHFHLYARFKNYATGHVGTKWEMRGKFILNALHDIVTSRDEARVEERLDELKTAEGMLTHQFLKAKLIEFFRSVAHYRTYLAHPELNLPTTTNSAESFIRMVRELLGRSRGFRTAASLTKWLSAFCRYRKTVTCNGSRQPN